MGNPGDLAHVPPFAVAPLSSWSLVWRAARMEARRRGIVAALSDAERRWTQDAAAIDDRMRAAQTADAKAALVGELVQRRKQRDDEIRQQMNALFTPGAGLKLRGDAVHQQAYVDMVRREMLRSPGFHALMVTMNEDGQHPVSVRVDRNQPGILVDNFDSAQGFTGHQELDLADIQQLPLDPPAGAPSAITQGELLIHAMAEARQGALGDGYDAAHLAAIRAQNEYRDERGQPGHRRDPPYDGGFNAQGNWDTTYDNQYLEIWVMQGHSISRVNRM
jgi:hypothetical protein